ncbi:MAG TPA: DUF2332 family protein [Solirubrobacterales bacterium]|nr:DUF2332 family protein [Solirubrobacterales bacterium]
MVELPRLLLAQAGHCLRLGWPLYAELLERAASDAEEGGPVAQVLRGREGDPPDSMLVLRLMGAAHRRMLEGVLPDMGWPSFRQALVEDADAIRALLDRPVQTNEVGRCATLLPGFFAVAAATGLPLRLLEVGASAGLNLRWDRYRYETDGFAWGEPASPVRVGFRLEGGAPSAVPVEIADRRGCDPRPVDPASEEGRLTLLSFVWADQAERLRRLRAALAPAADLPVAVDRAGAAEWVAERLAAPADGVATVVFHSIVMQYLPEGERREFERRILAAGEGATKEAPLAWLRMEPAGERAEVRLTIWPGGEDRLLARVGYHGDPVQLLG